MMKFGAHNFYFASLFLLALLFSRTIFLLFFQFHLFLLLCHFSSFSFIYLLLIQFNILKHFQTFRWVKCQEIKEKKDWRTIAFTPFVFVDSSFCFSFFIISSFSWLFCGDVTDKRRWRAGVRGKKRHFSKS